MLTGNNHAFVVCAYKENPFLENTLESLEQQTIKSQIIISTSTPNEHICQIARKHNIPITVNKNPSTAGADWNHGYDEVDADLVTLAHQDDYYDADYLENILAAANQYDQRDLSLLFTDYYEIRNGERVDGNALLKIKEKMNAPLKSPRFNGSKLVKRRILGLGDSICCPSVTYAKCNIGRSIFDTKYINSCDYKTFVNLASAQGRFVYIPKRLMGHRIYEESATTLNLADNIRKKEDEEILATLWPKPIAKFINSLYSISEKSNEL